MRTASLISCWGGSTHNLINISRNQEPKLKKIEEAKSADSAATDFCF